MKDANNYQTIVFFMKLFLFLWRKNETANEMLQMWKRSAVPKGIVHKRLTRFKEGDSISCFSERL